MGSDAPCEFGIDFQVALHLLSLQLASGQHTRLHAARMSEAHRGIRAFGGAAHPAARHLVQLSAWPTCRVEFLVGRLSGVVGVGVPLRQLRMPIGWKVGASGPWPAQAGWSSLSARICIRTAAL